jgi:hypothetical protein
VSVMLRLLVGPPSNKPVALRKEQLTPTLVGPPEPRPPPPR